MRISVLGLGKMGAPMARQLIEVGHDVTLFDRTRERASDVAAKSVQAAARRAQVVPREPRLADSVADAVSEAQVALTMVSNDEAEEALTFGADGLLAHLPPGAIHLCMSTIGLETSRKLALAHAKAGQGYVAAPVFGRPGTAVSGNLWIVVGGPEIQVTRCLTIFDALAKGITRVGPRAELAHALKLGGNMLTVVMTEGLSEVLAYGEKAGMAPGEYLRLLNTAIFKSPMMDTFGGLMVRHLHDPADLTLDAALQDMQMVIQASEELDAVMPMAELLHQRLELAAVQGWGAEDLTVLSRSCRLAAGLERREGKDVPEPFPQKANPTHFPARSAEGEVMLELNQITHFEIVKDSVWAWTQGKRYCTAWKHLVEVERTFGHIPFLRIHRHILLQPGAVLAHKHSLEGTRKDPSMLNPEEHLYPHPTGPREEEETPGLGVAPPTGDAEGSGVVWIRDGWRSLVDRVSEHVPFHRPSLPILLENLFAPKAAQTGPLKTPWEESEKPLIRKLEDRKPPLPAGASEETQEQDLAHASHFKIENGSVWAWIRGKRVRTAWRSLSEVEAAFSYVVLVKIKRNLLLHPEAVVSLQLISGGRAKVTVTGGLELNVPKPAVDRLKEVLGI